MATSFEFQRRTKVAVSELLAGFRAIVINGPRQAGKSTLISQIQQDRGPVVSLDNRSYLDMALNDPELFLDSLDQHCAIDEFQRGGNDLLLALKTRLDASNQKGQYILAGSTRFLAGNELAETLTGRVGLVDLLPLSVGERLGIKESFLERLFDSKPDSPTTNVASENSTKKLARDDYAGLVAGGGFPELILGPNSQAFRSAWIESYIETVTAIANVEQVAELRKPELLQQLLHQVAARSSNELVTSDLARELNSSSHLVENYLHTLSALYLIRLLPAWSTSETNRAKKRPVGHILDTSIAAHLLGETGESLAEITNPWFGLLLESFVVGEVAKQATWADFPIRLSHFRDRSQREVDLVIERGRKVAAIEVKATSTPRLRDCRHLEYLRDKTGERFTCGIVLHTGETNLQLSDRIFAKPISDLWA